MRKLAALATLAFLVWCALLFLNAKDGWAATPKIAEARADTAHYARLFTDWRIRVANHVPSDVYPDLYDPEQAAFWDHWESVPECHRLSRRAVECRVRVAVWDTRTGVGERASFAMRSRMSKTWPTVRITRLAGGGEWSSVPTEPFAVPGTTKIKAAKAVAARVWGNPCGGSVNVQWDVSKTAAAWVAWDQRPGSPKRCTVWLSRLGPGGTGEPDDRWTWEWLCTYMLHEYGHLAGMNHSDNPRSVMFHQPPMDRRCLRRPATLDFPR